MAPRRRSVQEMKMKELRHQVKELQEQLARHEVAQQGPGRTSDRSSSNEEDDTNPFHYLSSSVYSTKRRAIKLKTWESKLIFLSLKGGSTR